MAADRAKFDRNPQKVASKDDPFADPTVFQEWMGEQQSQPFPRYSEKPDMANKFLPFIVESSTPKHIFKTLMSRSKGMNNVLVASIFNLTLNIEIKILRDIVKDLPEMPLTNLYEELLQKYEQFRVEEEVLMYFRKILNYLPTEGIWNEEMKEFTNLDIMTFLCVLSQSKAPMEEYTEYDFRQIHNYNEVLLHFRDHVIFSDHADHARSFVNATDLKAYILYHAVLRKQVEPDAGIPRIKAEFKKVQTKAGARKKPSFGDSE